MRSEGVGRTHGRGGPARRGNSDPAGEPVGSSMGRLQRRWGRPRIVRGSACALALLAVLCGCRTAGDAPGDGDRASADAGPAGLKAEARRLEELYRVGGPQAADACAAAARARVQTGDLDRALALVGEGLAASPAHPDLLQTRANVLDRMGFRRAAEACYGEALEVEPDRTPARLARGLLRLELGLAALAREDLERCLAEGEDGGEAWLALAQSLLATGEPRRAYDAFASAFARGAGSARCLLAAAQMHLDGELRPPRATDAERAEAWTRMALERLPGWPRGLYVLACLREQRGDFAGASRGYERVVELAPDHADALARLAEVRAALGDSRGATESALRALEIEQRPERRVELRALIERRGRVARSGPSDGISP